VARYFGHTAWLVRRGYVTHTLGPQGPSEIRSTVLLCATGTYERVVPFPGWTLPGVIGLGAATVLLKSQKALPGRRIVVAGCGPLLPLVAASVLEVYGTVVAMVDLNGPSDLWRAAGSAWRKPRLAGRGLGWLARLALARVPVYWRHAVAAVMGRHGVEEVRIVPVDRSWRPRPGAAGRTLEADTLAIGHGLVPGTEVTRLLGAAHEYRPAVGGWVARLTADLETTVPGLYVAGDGGGVAGADAAGHRGRLAALAAARSLGRLDDDTFAREAGPVRAALARAESFGAGMASLMAPRPGLIDTVTADSVVCRCEDVTRGELENALDQQAGDLNQLKAWTRCGMGPCQGRMCAETAAELLARRASGGPRPEPWTPRPPIRPVDIGTLTGPVVYSEIPLPPPAPS
jgi:bacterioferritin-associated ferredoxin